MYECAEIFGRSHVLGDERLGMRAKMLEKNKDGPFVFIVG